jgi:hypothetical protein
MKLEIGNFEKIVFGNRFISLESYGKSKMFVDGHLEHQCMQCSRHWKDHLKNDRRSDQDHRLKLDRRSDQDHPFKKKMIF